MWALSGPGLALSLLGHTGVTGTVSYVDGYTGRVGMGLKGGLVALFLASFHFAKFDNFRTSQNSRKHHRNAQDCCKIHQIVDCHFTSVNSAWSHGSLRHR